MLALLNYVYGDGNLRSDGLANQGRKSVGLLVGRRYSDLLEDFPAG